mmetsp:Transcript_118207/g.235470  ORF Transcript_118207/g.235470 Transcript_118207/m.235470 type:complete len:98 (-) Transcript_118207:2456-2749(-)
MLFCGSYAYQSCALCRAHMTQKYLAGPNCPKSDNDDVPFVGSDAKADDKLAKSGAELDAKVCPLFRLVVIDSMVDFVIDVAAIYNQILANMVRIRGR